MDPAQEAEEARANKVEGEAPAATVCLNVTDNVRSAARRGRTVLDRCAQTRPASWEIPDVVSPAKRLRSRIARPNASAGRLNKALESVMFPETFCYSEL